MKDEREDEDCVYRGVYFWVELFANNYRDAGSRIVGVATAPQAFSIYYSPNKPVQNVLHADFLEFCKSNALPCYQIRENMREAALYDCLKTWSPDLMIVVGWYHLIPKSLCDL